MRDTAPKRPRVTVAEFRLGGAGPGRSERDDEYSGDRFDPSRESMLAACSEIMRAIKREDEKALCSALEAFVEAKEAAHDEDDEEEEPRGKDDEEGYAS